MKEASGKVRQGASYYEVHHKRFLDSCLNQHLLIGIVIGSTTLSGRTYSELGSRAFQRNLILVSLIVGPFYEAEIRRN